MIGFKVESNDQYTIPNADLTAFTKLFIGSPGWRSTAQSAVRPNYVEDY